MSDTPQTDAIAEPTWAEGEVVSADFARQLERERDQLRAELVATKKELESTVYNQGCKDRDNDQLRAEVERMTKIAGVAETRLAFTERERDQIRAEHNALCTRRAELLGQVEQLRAEVERLKNSWVGKMDALQQGSIVRFGLEDMTKQRDQWRVMAKQNADWLMVCEGLLVRKETAASERAILRQQILQQLAAYERLQKEDK